jgi:hypothetical protein
MFGGPPPAMNNAGKTANNMPGVMPPPAGFPRFVQSPFTTSYEYLFRDSLIASVKDTVGLPVYFSTSNGTKIV